MEATIIKLLDISAVSSIVICIVLLLRLCLKKAPAYVRCLLWALVGIRLIMPFGIESSLSLIPDSAPVSNYVENAAGESTPVNDTEQDQSNVTDQTPVQPAPVVPDTPTEIQPSDLEEKAPWAKTAFWIWLSGAAVILCYMAGSYIWMYIKVKDAIVYDECTRIYSGDMIPFVLGVISPKIYLPNHLNTEQMNCIISHEKAHLKRCDHLIKPLAFLLLAAHWLNPLVWAAYILLCKDIELACDEKVIKEMNTLQRKLYSETLLLCSTKRLGKAVPLAFGEVGVKERIKKVMYYKKPSFWIIIAAVIAIAAVGVFFITNPAEKDSSDSSEDISAEQSTEQSAELPSSEDESSVVESEDISLDISKDESKDESTDTSADTSTDESKEESTDVSQGDVSQGGEGGGATVVLPYQTTHETPEGLGRFGIEADQKKYWFGKVHPAYVVVWDKEETMSDDTPIKTKGMKIWLCDRNGNKIDYVYTNSNGIAKFEITVKGLYTVCYDGDDKYAPLSPVASFEITSDYYVSPNATVIKTVILRKDVYLYDKNKFFPFTVKVYDSVTKEPIEGVRVSNSLNENFALTDANGTATTRPLAELAPKGTSATGRWTFGFYADGYDYLQAYAQTQDTELVVYLNPTTYHPYTIKIINQQTREPVQGVQLIINSLGDNSVIYTEFSGADGIVSGMKTSQDMDRSEDVQLYYVLDVVNSYGNTVECKTWDRITLNKEQTEYTAYLSIDEENGGIRITAKDEYYWD